MNVKWFVAFLGISLLGQQDDLTRQTRELIDQLRSDSFEEREEARVKLSALGKAALPELEKAATSKDVDLASQARIIIRTIKLAGTFTPALKKAVPGVTERLISDPPETWTFVFLDATREKEKGAPSPPDLTRKDVEPLALKALINATSPQRKVLVCQAIVRFDCRSTIPELLRELRDPKSPIRFHALKTLSELGAKEAVPDIIRLLDDRVLRNLALSAVERMQLKEAVPRLLQFLESGDNRLKAASLRVLGTLGTDIPPERLALLAGDEDHSLGYAAACIIVERKLKETVPGLTKHLKSKFPRTRKRSIGLLKTLNARETAPAVAHCLEDPAREVREAAVAALETFRYRKAIPEMAALLEDQDSGVRTKAIGALATLGAREAAPLVVTCLIDEDHNVRYAAVWAVRKLRAREAIPSLLELLACNDSPSMVGFALVALRATEAVPDLSRVLAARYPPEVRAAAARTLGGLGARESIPSLVAHLDDSNPQVQGAARWALRELNAMEAVIASVRVIERGSESDGWSAANNFRYHFRHLAAEDTVPQLLKLLSHESPSVRGNAAAALGWMGASQAVPDLMPLLVDEDSRVRLKAAMALGDLGAPKAEPALIKLLSDPGEYVRKSAVEALGQIGAHGAIPEIAQRLEDESRHVRYEAMTALQALDAKDAAGAIRKLLKDPDVQLQMAAAKVLGELGDKDSIPALLKLLREEEGLWLTGAVRALGMLDAREAIPDIVRYLGTHSVNWPGSSRSVAVNALIRLKATEAVPDLRKYLGHRDKVVRSCALLTLGGLRAKEVAPDVISLFEDEVHEVRRDAIRAAVSLGAKEAIPKIRKLLEDENEYVRRRAIGALSDFNDRESAHLILPLLDDPGEATRRNAAEVLGNWGVEEAIPGLLKLLEDGRNYVRIAAASSLCRLGSKKGVPILFQEASISRFTHLYPLNALRSPEAWKRLELRCIRGRLDGPRGPILELLKKSDELPSEAQNILTSKIQRSIGVLLVRGEDDRAQTMTGLKSILNGGKYDVILESERLRVVTPEQAVAFWSEWWSKENGDR